MRIITAARSSGKAALATLALLPVLGLGVQAPAVATTGDKPETLRITDSHRETVQRVVAYAERAHYEHIAIDDELSKQTLRNYIDLLDGQKLYFLKHQEEYFLKRYGAGLDDAMQRGQLDPVLEIYRLFRARMSSYFDFALDYLATRQELNTDRVWVRDREDTPRSTSQDQMNEVWRDRVRHELINLMLDERNYDEAAEALTRRYERQRKSLYSQDADDVFSAFMNAFTHTLDPHSTYFSPHNYEEYRIQMSRAYHGIGASLGVDDDYVVVREVLSGGPADKDGRLRAGDRITGVDSTATGEVADIVGWRLEDVVELIRGPLDTPVALRILPGGDTLSSDSFMLELTRGRVLLMGAQKELLNIERDGLEARVGVVRIPNFYFDMEGREAGLDDYPSSTRDVKRLISELKSDGAAGLILDLRRNGGGHLNEAISLAGLFVGKGPVVQVRDAESRTQVLQNRRQQPIWDGPLVVLVDRLSASASEILAAAIQDYGRGVVVGQRTFGKGTVQNIYPIRRRGEDSPGRLTLTMGKYYRVTGESTQNRGVAPDITLSAAAAELPLVFPNQVIGEDIGESASENALPWDTIPQTEYREGRVDGATLSMLVANHQRRESEDPDLRLLKGRIEAMQELTGRKAEPINLEQRRADQQARRAERLTMTNEWLTENELPPIDSLEQLRGMDLPDVALEQASEVVVDLLRLQAASSAATASSSLH